MILAVCEMLLQVPVPGGSLHGQPGQCRGVPAGPGRPLPRRDTHTHRPHVVTAAR